MAVSNAWSVGSITSSTPQLKQPCRFDFMGKKDTNLSFLGINKPISQRTRRLSCHSTHSSSSSSDSDWNRWTRHFSEIEQIESLSSVLKFQLEEAIQKEDFQKAVKLKRAIAEATSKDAVAEIMFQLKNAIDEEHYHEASRLCKLTGCGLVGWWVGSSKDSNDPFGRVVRITPGVGRFVARSYTPRQLVTASSGTPLFEIFVSKEADQSYSMQVVFLQLAKRSSTNLTLSPSPSRPTDSASVPNPENPSTDSSQASEDDSAEGNGVKNLDSKDANNIVDSSEEGLKSVIDYLKEKIPGSRFKIIRANIPKEMIGNNESMEQVVQDDDTETSSAENLNDDAHSKNDIRQDKSLLDGGTDASDEEKHSSTKIFIGGISHNKDEALSKDDYVRSAAEIKDMEKDSFILHIPGRRNGKTDLKETLISTADMEAVAVKAVSELMPLEVAKTFFGLDKNASKVSVKLAASKQTGLSRNTYFSRIATSKDDLDPFDGLYVGAFGPLGVELVQLRRKFGHWHGENDKSDVEFYEYVEAVKLTGDLNVPVGQVTFRAKIGRVNRNSSRGKYPDDLGVVASYKGQGMIADVGFQNPRWVDGELLQMSGKGMWPYIGGADLGFLYVVPEKSFLVLLNRLKLPE